LLRTCSSRIRVYLLCELALQRKVHPFFCSKTKFTQKNLRYPLNRENTSQTARPNRQAVKRRLSVFPIELRKLLLQVGNFWQIVDLNVGTIQVMLQVVLVIVFRGIESL